MELYSEENKTFQGETIPTELYIEDENTPFLKGKFVKPNETKLKEEENKGDEDSKSDGKYGEGNKDTTKQVEIHPQFHKETEQINRK